MQRRLDLLFGHRPRRRIHPQMPFFQHHIAFGGDIGVGQIQIHHPIGFESHHQRQAVFGDALEDLKALAQELSLQDYVRFTGPIFGEDLRRILAAADICVDSAPANPYTDRSTMFKIMEYMSLGKPIVGFDLPEHRFTAGGSAVYVTPNDERAFARALEKLMGDPARREALGAFGRERIKPQLAWEYSIPNLLAAYRKILPASGIAEPEASCEPARIAQALQFPEVCMNPQAGPSKGVPSPIKELEPKQTSHGA